MATRPATTTLPAPPPPIPGRVRLARQWLPRLLMAILWVSACGFLLRSFFHFLGVQHVQQEAMARQLELGREAQRMADWRQKTMFAQSPDWLDAAVKELTLTRDPSEIEIQVEPSPVPPVGDIR